jgi:hypothetical protein
MITREQFSQHFNSLRVGLGDDDSPLWIAERTLSGPCVAFITINSPVKFDVFEIDFLNFWEWCDKNLLGEVRCFSSSEDEEWWGFTNPNDIVLWALKWA